MIPTSYYLNKENILKLYYANNNYMKLNGFFIGFNYFLCFPLSQSVLYINLRITCSINIKCIL